MLRNIVRRLREAIRASYRNKHVVLRHNGPHTDRALDGYRFERYTDFDTLPAAAVQGIRRFGSDTALEKFRIEMRDRATLWVAFDDDHLVGHVMTRQGRHFRSWFFDLAEHDVVVFRGRTDPDYRGLGVGPALINHALANELGSGGQAWADYHIDNQASRRMLEKLGFHVVATMKPISREEALGPASGQPGQDAPTRS